MSRAAPGRPPELDGYSLLLETAFDAARIRAVRRGVAEVALANGLSPHRTEVFLITVHEIMTNAVRHGGGGGELRLWRNGDLMCDVDDAGAGFASAPYLDRTEAPAPTSTGGMGLWLARQLSDWITIRSGPTGTTVRVSIRLPPGHGSSGR